jgi:hypothetical protein
MSGTQKLRQGARGRTGSPSRGRPSGRNWPHAVRVDLSAEQLAKVKRLARYRGGMSAAIRHLIDEASA